MKTPQELFESAKKSNEVTKKNRKSLAIMLLGPSGAGKSFAMGTFGCKTLYISTSNEPHGIDSARLGAKMTFADNAQEIVEYNLQEQAQLVKKRDKATSDDHLLALTSILDGEFLVSQGIGAIAIDSLKGIESLISSSVLFAAKTEKNAFAKTDVTINMIMDILTKLDNLRLEYGIHYAMSCHLDVKEMSDNGYITDSKPAVTGWRVAESIVHHFSEYVMVGKMFDKKGNSLHRFQFGAKAVKCQSGTMKNPITVNYAPRIAGINLKQVFEDKFGKDSTRDTLECNLKDLIDIKEEYLV